MWELRWILLTMGVVFIGGLYLWHRKPIPLTFRRKRDGNERAEPSITGLGAPASPDNEDTRQHFAASIPANAEKIITLRFMGRGHSDLDSVAVVGALQSAGLKHGRYGIFHSFPEISSVTPRFSVASLTEPGTFDLADLDDKPISGMSFFMVLPSEEDPVICFDEMIQTARALSLELDGELFDEQGSSWSIQRERYIREEIIEFRHQRSQA